jgi:hypothetical protein
VPDDSHLDAKYFIDGNVYNCPFCNRRHVSYDIEWTHTFNWTDSKPCTAIFVKCRSCRKQSMHLTFADIVMYEDSHSFKTKDIDAAIFYSVPSSFHVVDARIPRILRELLTEAEGCHKSNFLTGASACARKLIYELAIEVGAEGDDYEDRIKSLKKKLPEVDSTYFDTLLTIQQVTSAKVHEQSYDGWESKHLRLILATIHEALQQIFVVPKVREEKRKAIRDLKSEVIDGKPMQPKP